MEDLTRKFLTNTDETGRFIVTSRRTGRTYYVEPIGGRTRIWGDLPPDGIGKPTGAYGTKHRGSIDAGESLITPETGFDQDNTHILEPGVSPLAFIDQLDAKYPDKKAS